MKIRTTLGVGLAVAAVATTAMGVAASAATAADGSWHTKVGDYGTSAGGMVLSGDGSTAYVLVNGVYDEQSDSMSPTTVVPVNVTTGAAGTAAAIPATVTYGLAASGDTAAVAGYDADYNSLVWTVRNGQVGSIPLTGADGAYLNVNGVTSTDGGFLAFGTSDNCLATWTWATDDTTATAGTPQCSETASYSPLEAATEPGTGTVYAAVAVYGSDDSTTYELWNLSDTSVAPIELPASWTAVDGITVTGDGTVYVAGNEDAGDNTEVATIDPADPESTTVRGTGLYPSSPTQLGVVGDQLWVGSWEGIGVLAATGTTSYTPDSPAPMLNTDSGSPQNFATTDGADYLLVPWDSAFSDADGSDAPGVLKVVAPAAPAPKVAISGTKATVSWNDATDGGTAITSVTVTATDTTKHTTRTPVTKSLDGDSASVAVGGLTPGDSYSFSVTQSNGFFTSAAGTVTGKVALTPTAKPSKVTVVGTPEVGRKLTIKNTGSWASGAKLTYTWYAGSKKVGTASSYTPKAADAGAKIKVTVTGVATGHAPSNVTSAAVGPVIKPVYKVTHKPTITGTPKVGKTLTAHITGLPKGATVKYQWGEDRGQSGGPVGRATSSPTLKVPASVRGARLEVFVMVTVPGYSTGSARSGLTGVVK